MTRLNADTYPLHDQLVELVMDELAQVQRRAGTAARYVKLDECRARLVELEGLISRGRWLINEIESRELDE